MTKNIARIESFLTPIVESLGCEIVDTELVTSGGRTSLTLFIYKENGVGISDCEAVHRAIDGPLDELDPTDGKPYTLNVSSPGLDRAFKRDRDFQRATGKDVTVNLFAPADGKKEFGGRLFAFDSASVTLETDEGQTVIEREKIAKISLTIDFKGVSPQ